MSNKDDVIRFRCEHDLRARFARVAALLRRDEPDLARIWFEDSIADAEAKLGLVLRRDTLHDRPAATAPPVQPASPVTYPGTTKKKKEKPPGLREIVHRSRKAASG